MELFSLRRSIQRGIILETTNRVSNLVITLMNRWRKKEGTKVTGPNISMQQIYTQIRDKLPHLKLYSTAE